MAQFLFQFSTITSRLKRSKLHFILTIFIVATLLNGCIKDNDVKSITLLTTNTTNDFLRLAKYNDRVKIVGGDTWYSGEVLSFDNGLISTQFTTDITFLNIKYDTLQERFVGVGLNGSYYEIGDSVTNYSNGNYQVIRDIYFSENYNVLVGGKSYALGYVYKIDKDKRLQLKTEIPHEFRALDKIGNKLYAAGFGIVATSIDQGITWQKTSLEGDFFLSIVKTSNNKTFIIGQENTIYSTSDQGQNWSKAKAPGKEQVNHARYINDKLHLFCNDGIIKVSSKVGNEWTKYKIGQFDINDGIEIQNEILVIGENGFAALVKLD